MTEYPTTIRLDPALKSELNAYARGQGASLSWLIVDILRDWLEWRKAREKVEATYVGPFTTPKEGS